MAPYNEWDMPVESNPWYASVLETPAINKIIRSLVPTDAPRNAAFSAVKELTQGDPTTALSKGWEGLGIPKAPTVHSLEALLGVPAPSPQDDWPTWLALTAAHLWGDSVTDPLRGVGPVMNIIKKGSKYQKASEVIHGSSFGRSFMEEMPAHRKPIEDIYQSNLMDAAAKSRQSLDEIISKQRPYEDFINQYPGGEIAARDAWVRGRGGLDPDVEQLLTTLKGMQRAETQNVNALGKTFGMDKIHPEIVDAYSPNITPRPMTSEGIANVERKFMEGLGRKPSTGEIDAASRQYKLLVDVLDPNNPSVFNPKVDAQGRPIVSKVEKVFGVEKEPNQNIGLVKITRDGMVNEPGQVIEATLKDILDSGRNTPNEFVANPAIAYHIDLNKKLGQGAFLKTLDDLTERAQGVSNYDDYLTSFNRGLTDKPFVEVSHFEHTQMLPDNYRRFKVPGFENIAGPKDIVNRFEKVSRSLWDANTPLGKLEELFDSFGRTKLGGLLKEGNQWWKSNTLGDLSTSVANQITNPSLMYQAGMDIKDILPKIKLGRDVFNGKGPNIFSNITNKEFGDALADAGVYKSTWAGQEGRDLITKAMNPRGKVRRYAEEGNVPLTDIPLPDAARTALKGVAYAGEKVGDFNKWMLGISGKGENYAKIGAAIDYLQKKGITSPTQQDILDAAGFAKKALIDYGALTPLERGISSTVVPFGAWQRGMIGQTLRTLRDNPERLAQYSRIANAVFDPMAPEDYNIADAWMQEQVPTSGAFGVTWDDMYKKAGEVTGLNEPFPQWFEPKPQGPRVWALGRYIPQGNLDQAMSRPSDFAFGSVSPFLRAPLEILMNRSSFRDRPIDPIATDTLGMFTAPLSGSDLYSKAQVQPFGIGMPAGMEYLMSQIPGGRKLSTISELGRNIGLWDDPYRTNAAPPDALSALVAGAKLYGFDKEKAMRRRKMDLQKQEREIKSQMKFAASKGDEAAVEHYIESLREHADRKARVMGIVAEALGD